ncbi:MAG: hypothetical protein IT427_08105 [Pirellulales bacterium]|nr:hypothetical protein [Pirellulales bacterium]
MIHRHIIASLIFVAASSSTLWAQQTEVGSDGRTYQVTKQVYQRLTPETHYVDQQYTVYSPRTTTEYHPTTRTVYTPVTEYQWEPYLANRWNPFSSPNVQYRYVPRTRWEIRNEQLQVPVTRQEYVPEVRTQRVAVQSHRVEDVEQTTRVAVRTSGSDPFGNNTTAVAAKPIGSTGQLTSDPPRTAQTGSMWGGSR